MPEGDTLFRTAVTLRKALLNKTVTRFDSSVEEVSAVLRRCPLEGRNISHVEARGKHLLITFAPVGAGDGECEERTLVLHTHLRMTGSWHIYRPGEAWQKPERYAKVVIYTNDFVAPCFSAPVVELLTEWQAQRHPSLAGLGPDAMTEEFDPEAAFQRLRRHPDAEIGVAIMNQKAMAGVGNVYKSEVLFIRRLSPFRKVKELSDDDLRALIAESHRLLRLNEKRGDRQTHFSLRSNEKLWAYGRSGEPCRVCGERIRMRRQGFEARSTYFCPRCQAPPLQHLEASDEVA